MYRTTLCIMFLAFLLDVGYVVVVEPMLYVSRIKSYNTKHHAPDDISTRRKNNFANITQINSITPLGDRWHTYRIREAKDLIRFPDLCTLQLKMITWHDLPGRNELSEIVCDVPTFERVTEVHIDAYNLDRWPVADLRELLSWPQLEQIGISASWELDPYGCMMTRFSSGYGPDKLKESLRRIARIRPVVEEWYAALVAANSELPQEVEWNYQDRVCHFLLYEGKYSISLPRPEGYQYPPWPVSDWTYFVEE